MNVSLFISRRLIGKTEYRFSKPIIRIAITAIALSVCIMLLSLFIIKGFQKNITNKVIGFNGHIQIMHYNQGNSFETSPLSLTDSLSTSLKSVPGIAHYQVYATKAAIIKTDNDIHGVLFKGLSHDMDSTFLSEHLVEGHIPLFSAHDKSNKVVISKRIADKLTLTTGQKIHLYFVQTPMRVRSLEISGIYHTGVAEYDEVLVLGDIGHIQKLNDWQSNQIGGIEILLHSFDHLEKMQINIASVLPYYLNAETVFDQNPQLFDWLELQNINVRVILILMLIVGAINMVTALFILIMEKTHLIGTLKALGSANWTIRNIFLYHSAYLIIRGLVFGNGMAFLLAIVQHTFKLIKLNPETYYMSFIPINFDWLGWMGINVGTLVICSLVLIIPSFIISKIKPINAIRFE